MIEPITKEYTITRLNKTNLKDLARLHSEVYDVPVREDFFYKKYDTGYTGTQHVGYIAYSQTGVPIAFYGVIPCLLEYGNEIMLAAQSADTMTHPLHRYKGMFVELSRMTFDLCIQSGIKLVFGFPNQNSYPAMVNKLGWKPIERMELFTIYVNSFPLEKLMKNSKFLRRVYNRFSIGLINKYRSNLKGLPSSVISNGFAGVHRNSEYLEYKTYNDSTVICIDNVNIWISTKHGITIGDIEGISETNFKAVISGIKKIASGLGKKKVQFHCSPDTSPYSLLTSEYNASPSFHVLYQDFGSGIPPEKIRFTFADIDIF